MKVLIVGASGMLGQTVVEYLRRNKSFNIFECSRSSKMRLDLTDQLSLIDVLEKLNPDAIINLAALADVDACEKDPGLAFEINSRTCQNLRVAIDRGIRVIHISTDHLYDDFKESSEHEIKPLNYYAYSKLLGETFLPGSLILRTNFFGKSLGSKKSFSDWIFSELKSSRSIGLFSDSYFSPLTMSWIAEIIENLLSDFRPGIYNLGSHEGMSKYEFGVQFAQGLGLDTSLIRKTSLKSASLLAKRPLDMRMNVRHFEKTFNYKLPVLKNLIAEESKKYSEYP